MYVALAQRKEDRKAHLQAQYMQRVSTGIRMQVCIKNIYRHEMAMLMNHIFLECSSNYGWRSTNDWWFIFYASNASPTKPVHAKTRPNDQSYSKMGKSTCKLDFVDTSRVSDQELKVYFRCQWQISDPECQWVNHLKVNIMCLYKNVVILDFSPWRTTTVQVNKYGA